MRFLKLRTADYEALKVKQIVKLVRAVIELPQISK